MIIIYAHPNKTGHNGYCLKKVIESLDSKNIKYKLIDLYALHYNPVLSQEELTLQGKKSSSQIKTFQKDISDSKQIIIIYPTWWQNVPAILKGFFDRVFSAGFAFKYKGHFPVGLLKGKKAVVITSTGGPAIFSKVIKCSRSLKVVTSDTLEFCGIKTKGYTIGSARKLTDSQKKKIDKIVNKGMKFVLD